MVSASWSEPASKGAPDEKLLPIWLLLLFIATAYTLIMLSRPRLSRKEIEPGRVLATAVMGLLVAAGIFGVVRWQEVRERKKPWS